MDLFLRLRTVVFKNINIEELSLSYLNPDLTSLMCPHPPVLETWF